jgi:hypothetical protein
VNRATKCVILASTTQKRYGQPGHKGDAYTKLSAFLFLIDDVFRDVFPYFLCADT